MRIVNAALKRSLRSRAHALKPVVIVADRGLDEPVVEEARRALERHELIKVRIRHERDARARIADELCEATGAALIQAIGQVVCLYKPRPPKSRSDESAGARPARRGTGRPAQEDGPRARPWGSPTERKRSRNAGKRHRQS